MKCISVHIAKSIHRVFYDNNHKTCINTNMMFYRAGVDI